MMKNFMNINHKAASLVGGGIIAAVALTACADWNDHYEADSAVVNTQVSTLWENIEGNSSLSQFAALLKKTGYDKVLSESQTYTVWAPLNGTFDYETLLSATDSRLTKEFVQNHIARNNYPISGNVDELVYMLNEKVMAFSGNGNYSIQGVSIDQMNVASSNGMLHMVRERIPFRANIYESLHNEEFAIDSVSNYFHHFDEKVLNEQRSVPGPIVNGEKTYRDSIFDEDNDLYLRYRAYINREDSNYTMIVPTNEAWIKAKNAIGKYFNYVSKFDYIEGNTAESKERKTTKIELKDIEYLKDSMVNMMLMNDLFYNNNLYDNTHLNTLREGQQLVCDSLYSTTLTKVYSEDAALLFEDAHRVDKSNGAIWVTDSLRMRTWTSWNPEIKLEAERTSYVSGWLNTNGKPSSVYVTPGMRNAAVTGKLSNSAYLEADFSSLNTAPHVDFYLPDVRSAAYSVYVVFVPGTLDNENYEAKPYNVSFTMNYVDKTGAAKSESFVNPASESGSGFYNNDVTKIDTIYVGDFTFPVAYIGTGGASEEYCPYLHIQNNITSRQRDMFDRPLRIDCIILRPKELVEHLQTHPDYKYNDGNY